jgi:acyl carrier protein
MEKKKIEEVVIAAFHDYFETQDIQDKVDTDTVLFGGEAALDSMGLVNVVIDIESFFHAEGYNISLTSERAMSRRSSPFRTVSTLVDFIAELIDEASK